MDKERTGPAVRQDMEQTAPLPEMKKLYISLHKSYCYQMDDKFREGKQFNVMTIPKGTRLDGRDIGGSKITPMYMSENKFNANEMTATYYVDPGSSLPVKLSLPDGTYEKVDVAALKEAIDAQKQSYREQQMGKVQEQQKDDQLARQIRQTAEKTAAETKARGEEIGG